MKKTLASDLKHLRCWCMTAFVFWTFLLNGSFWLFVQNERKSIKFIGKEIGLAAISKDHIYRAWNAQQGGVYVRVSKTAAPNPYLSKLPDRDLVTKDGQNLTLINPAYMTRQVHELELEMYGVFTGHITSLHVVRPENKPDEWEKKALLQFEQGKKEFSELITQDGKPVMRVMTPTVVQQSCLKCHVEQGDKVGDIRGGISAIVQMESTVNLYKKQFKDSLLYHLLIYFIGVTGQVVFYLQSSKLRHKRETVEQELSVQEQYLREIVDNISNGIAVYETEDGENFRVKRINPAGMRIAKIDGQIDPAGKKPAEVFPGFAETNLEEVFRRVAKNGSPEHLSISGCIKKKDGGSDSPCLEYYVYKLPTGEIVTVYEDVTSRKKARELLIRKTEEWESTFDAIPDIITLQDKEMRIIRANQATFEFFRLPPDKLLGRTCHSLFRGSDQPCETCPGLRAIGDLKKHCGSIEHKAIDRFFSVCAAPVLNSEGEFLYFVYIAHDVTDKKKLEDELIQAQKMEAIGTLAGGIAHDFNNILAAILGYTELARIELPEGSNAWSDLEQVIIAGNRATELVKQILTFSRKSEHQKKPLRIYLLVKEAVKMLRSSLPSTIEMRADIDENSGLVLADPTNIHQIVFNLCTNAAHAIGGRQGRMEIILRQAELTRDDLAERPCLAPGQFIILTVRDNGCGMNETTMARIFDPYFTTKEQGAGTGLGLAVTHGVVKDCGGFIEVESELGKGSAFHVYLPTLPDESAEAPVADRSCSLPTGTERILFVDDEPSIVHISQEILSTLGYTVAAEVESLAALELFKAAPDTFDLLITDQTMPGLTGSELTKAVLALRPELPVILCTGYTAAVSEKDALAIGVRRYAIKPLNTAKLATLVREVLDEKI
jgi:PAS domain S-box-containing protein